MNGMRKSTFAAAAIALASMVTTAPAVLGTATASALTLSCRASMVDATPKPGTRPVVKVTSSAGAALTVVARFPGGATTHSGTVSSTGIGKVAVAAKGRPGVTVRVEVKARKKTSSASCVTAFQPGGVPGTRPAVPAGTKQTTTATVKSSDFLTPPKTSKPAAPTATARVNAGASPTASGTDAITDLYGGFVGLDVNCWYGQNTVDLSVLAISDTPTYYRSFRFWVYSYTAGTWSSGNWTDPVASNTAFVKSMPMLPEGWYAGYLEYAAHDGSQWHYYGTYGNHFHGLMYGSPLTGSPYLGCHA